MNRLTVTNRNRAEAITIGLAIVVLLSASAAPAGAATYYNVDCYCAPTADAKELPDLSADQDHLNYSAETGCICGENYTLGKLGTKEFRFRCKHDNARELPVYQNAFDRDKPTTCTVSGTPSIPYSNDEYGTMSCTNWSTLSTDTINLQTVCTARQ